MADTKSLVLARLVSWVHIGFVFFFVFGWALPSAILPWHIAAIPLVILHWKLNNDQCILTQWQRLLEGQALGSDAEGEFVRSLFTKMGLDLSRRQLLWVIYGLLVLSGVASALRLVFY